MEKSDIEASTKSSRVKWLIFGVTSVISMVIIACTILLVLHGTSTNHKLQWVGFRGSFDGREGFMNEESEVDADRKLIIHVNAEGYRLGINNSISLHDYQEGLLATRVMESGTCMIINLIDTYEEALAALHRFNETGASSMRPMRWFDDGVIISQRELDQQIGGTLADFCRGFPTVRLHEIPAESVPSRQRRSVQPVMRAVCIQNEFCLFRERTIDHILDNIDIYVQN